VARWDRPRGTSRTCGDGLHRCHDKGRPGSTPDCTKSARVRKFSFRPDPPASDSCHSAASIHGARGDGQQLRRVGRRAARRDDALCEVGHDGLWHRSFDPGLVLWFPGSCRVQQAAKVVAHLGIGAVELRVVDVRLEHTCLQVVHVMCPVALCGRRLPITLFRKDYRRTGGT
jgi:hypothetical protein